MYVISGLHSGHVAVYTKIHHAVIDGVSGAEITGLLLDLTPEGRPIPPAEPSTPERSPGSLQMWGRALFGVQRYPLRVLRSLPHALANLEETTLSSVPGVGQAGRLVGRLQRAARPDSHPVIRSPLPAPKTSFNRKVSPKRRVALGSLDLQRVKDVKNAFGVTVNDVVVSLAAGGVRRWLLDHKELPDQPLVAQIPVSVRTEEQAGTYGNDVLMLGAPLPTHVADPVARLQATAAGLGEMKERHRALPADVNHFIPPALFSRGASDLRVGHLVGGPPDVERRGVEHPRPTVPAVLRRGAGGGQLSAVGHRGRAGSEHHRDELRRSGGHRHRRRPRAGSDVWTLIDGLDLSSMELEDARP